jgi:hypothetical protein
MGVLVAKKYQTKLFLNAADHTYVECGTGARGWSCWGGKIGGTAFNSGNGSTVRADSIAQPNERAGITCYLINGVCHQAANRILLPAGILVTATRGYSVSSAMFGPYGRVGMLPCSAPFNQYPGAHGDLQACIAMSVSSASMKASKLPKVKGEDRHVRELKEAYNEFDPQEATHFDRMKFHVALFEREVKHRLGDRLGSTAKKGLRQAKENVELEHHQLATGKLNKELSNTEFVKAFNEMTHKFQDEVAGAISKAQYKKLMNLDNNERIVLADPDIVGMEFGEKTAKEVYGEKASGPNIHETIKKG